MCDQLKNRESGAVLLATVLVGSLLVLLLAASTMLMARSSSQSISGVSADNYARVSALVGMSALEQYLKSHESGGYSELVTDAPVGTAVSTTISEKNPAFIGHVRAVVTENTLSATGGSIVIQSTGTSGNTQATAVGVFNVVNSTGGSGNNVSSDAVPVSLTGYSELDGNLAINGGSNTTFADNGVIGASGSMTGMTNIDSTQEITLDGNNMNSDQNIFSDQDVTIMGSNDQFNNVDSLENVNSGTSVVNTIQANGTVAATGTVNTIISGDGSAGSGGVTFGGSETSPAGNIGTITTDGNVVQQGNVVNSVAVDGNYTEEEGTVNSGIVGGSITDEGSGIGSTVSQHGYQVNITPLTQYSFTQPSVNAYSLASQANFAVYPPTQAQADEYVAADVYVQNESDFTDGMYYMYNQYEWGQTIGGDGSLLCPFSTGLTFSNISECVSVATGYSGGPFFSTSGVAGDVNTIFGFEVDAGLGGSVSMAPGVWWFDGSADLGAEDDYDGVTIIAAYDIDLGLNAPTLTAPNYAGQSVVCGWTNYQGQNIYPTNFCDGSSFETPSVGNIALYAGGVDSSGDLTGGNIDIDDIGTTTIDGDVVAANGFTFQSNVVVNGYLQGAGEDASQTSEDSEYNPTNQFFGNVTVNLTGLPSSFTPGILSASQYSDGPSGSSAVVVPTVVRSDMYWQ